MNSDKSLTKTTIFLHWFIGLAIIAMIIVGYSMDEFKLRSLYPIHKSIGIILFVFILYRVIRRLIRGFPEYVADMNSMEKFASKAVLWVLLIGTLLFPISGMMMSGAAGHGLNVFGFELLAPNIVDGKAVPLNKDMAKLGHDAHGYLMIIMGIAILLHIAASLKHHFIAKDATLKRMLGKK
ncbi:MAG: cytochrome b [Gammaproteobacteria bacterium]|nr:cytochrome b [Xanthomonadales bacterium]